MPKKSPNQLKVLYSNNGLAGYYGDYIEINRALKYNKLLRDYVVKHEMGHSSQFDLPYEFADGLKLLTKPKIIYNLLKFYISNPSTWVDLFPIQYRNKALIYDINLAFLYGLMSIGIFILFKLF